MVDATHSQRFVHLSMSVVALLVVDDDKMICSFDGNRNDHVYIYIYCCYIL